jgi:pimeloyl-ACP methyl ester carboxylesterase
VRFGRGRSARGLIAAGAAGAAVLVGACGSASAQSSATGRWLVPCRLPGVPTAALCGDIVRPLDPARPQGVQITVHVAVLPAVARVRKADPVLFFAGGPGQSAVELAGGVLTLLSRLNNRRDLILVDQRGTGRSAPLACDIDRPLAAWRRLEEQLGEAARLADIDACRESLQRLPHGDLRQYTTAIAIGDVRAVLDALGVREVNVVGASYGTRAALEMLRQAPERVRRVVLDGVVPPDMNLPLAGSLDNQAALEGLWRSCESDAGCARRHPTLRADWQGLLAGLPRQVEMPHPLTGTSEQVVLTREALLGLVRAPLYVPALAAGLPAAVHEAARDRWAPLIGLASSLSAGRSGRVWSGMHFSVVCAEDAVARAAGDALGADFGRVWVESYARVCEHWPRGEVVAGFRTIPASRSPVWVLSGGADPVTPPRHGERVAAALGPLARHGVADAAGHGVMSLACVREAVVRFIDAETDPLASADLPACARELPRPAPFAMPGPSRRTEPRP